MKRLVIAVDCDDVLVASTKFLVEAYNQRYGTLVQLESAYLSGNPDWAAKREEVHRRINAIQLSDEYGSIAPSSEAIEAIGNLADNHELHLVTARAPKIKAVTDRMINDYFPDCFKSIEHVGFNTSKSQTCLNIGADILIDDNLKHLQEAKAADISHLLWFGDYQWQDRTAGAVGITVVRTWPEVADVVSRLSHE